MSDEISREERARQVSEALHGWCKAYGVRIAAGPDPVWVVDDDPEQPLFQFAGLGYEDRTADEVTIGRA